MEEDELIVDDFDSIHLGCLSCGSIFPANEIYGGGCPICESSEITTFEDVLAYVIDHKEFMEEMGLGEGD